MWLAIRIVIVAVGMTLVVLPATTGLNPLQTAKSAAVYLLPTLPLHLLTVNIVTNWVLAAVDRS
jgi:hypothetical protein